MAIDEKKTTKYIADLRKQFEKDPQKMEPFERRLIGRYEDAVAGASQADNEVRAIRGQINQANARIGSLEVQYADLQGKGAAYLESIIARKFEDDFDDDDEIVPVKKPKPSNGAPASRKQRRAAKSKKASKKTRSKTNSKSAASAA